MCLLLTTLAAIVAGLFWYFKDEDNAFKTGTLSLMYFGAALMWLVDAFFALSEGEGFLDLSLDDALLGFTIIICGLLAYLMLLVFRGPKKVFVR